MKKEHEIFKDGMRSGALQLLTHLENISFLEMNKKNHNTISYSMLSNYIDTMLLDYERIAKHAEIKEQKERDLIIQVLKEHGLIKEEDNKE